MRFASDAGCAVAHRFYRGSTEPKRAHAARALLAPLVELGLSSRHAVAHDRQNGVGAEVRDRKDLLLLALRERFEHEVDGVLSAGRAADPDAHPPEPWADRARHVAHAVV